MDIYIQIILTFFGKIAFYSICWGLLRKGTYAIIKAVTDGHLSF